MVVRWFARTLLHPTRQLRAGGLGVAFVGGFVLVYAVTVRTLSGRAVSDASLRGALLTNGLLARVVDPVLNVVSVASLLGAIAVILLVALARSARERGMVAIGVLVASNVSTLVLKRYLLPRPEFGLSEAAPSTLNSLPSGHTTAAMSLVVALLFVLPARLRWPTAGVGAAYVTVTGVATMSAGWHRAGDSLAAYLLVGFWATVAGVVLLQTGESQTRQSAATGRPRLARWWAVSGAGVLGLGAAIAALLAGAGRLRDSVVGPPIAFVAGGLLIGGMGAVVLLAVLWILEMCDGTAQAPADAGASARGPDA